MKPPVKLWLDSGAFSVWRAQLKGKPVPDLTVEEYASFVDKVAEDLECYITLDAIAEGKYPRTEAVNVKAAEASYTMFRQLDDMGLEPMPVFHQGEPWRYLQRYIDDGCEYIGLAGAKGPSSSPHVKRWCDQIFNVFTDAEGRPLVKFHGLGITQPELMQRYPWFSVDSTSWTLHAGFGCIYIPPQREDGSWDYCALPTSIHLSGWETQNKKESRRAEHMGGEHMKQLQRWLDEIKLPLAAVQESQAIRARANVIYYLGLQEQLVDMRFKHKAKGLFQNAKLRPANKKALKPWKLTMVFATFAKAWNWHAMMNELGADCRLISYAELRGMKNPVKVVNDFVTFTSTQQPPSCFKYKEEENETAEVD